MKEVAFTVNKESQFYKNYFLAKEERQKFHELAKAFFKKHNLFETKKYYQTEFLGLELTEEQKALYADQIKKNDDENGIDLYSILDRVSCWCCCNKNKKELRNIWKHLPEYWERLKVLQSKIDRPMKKFCNKKYGNYGNVFDMEKVFEKMQ